MNHQWVGVAMVFLAACSSDSTPPENPPDQAQATIGTAGGTVVTPSGAAGVQIPAGTFTQPVTVTVTQLAAPSTAGTGPLPTGFRQYPPYYEFTTSPSVPQFGDSVRVGVCQVTNPSDPLYAPEADHPRLKLAHTVGTGVEVLEPVGVTDFLRCTNVTASAQTSSRFALSSIITRASSFLRPRPAYAAHGGLGGKVKSFSPFGAVVDACVLPPIISANTTINGTIDAADCLLPGAGLLDVFTLSPAQPVTVKVTASGTGIAGVAMVLSLKGQGVGNEIFDRDAPFTGYVVLPVGNFIMGVYTGSQSGRGTYTLALQTTTIPDGCVSGGSPQGPPVILYPGVTVAGANTTNDCTGAQSNIYVDHYEITLIAGQNYLLSATGTGLSLQVGLPDGNGGLTSLKQQSNPSGSVSFTFQPTTTDVYVVNVIGIPAGKTGPYTLAISKL